MGLATMTHSDSPWKVAIIGSGYMAREHAKAFASLPSVQLVGICGRTRARADDLAAAFDTVAFDSIYELYAASQPDAVVVAVNELSMKAVCESCFRYPWAALLEKPVGIDLTQSEEILAMSERSAARCYVALNRRSYAATRAAIVELRNSDGPRLISVLDQQDMRAAREGGQPEEVVRNYMYANSIHLIDYFTLFGRGEITSVEPTIPWTAGQPQYVVATIRFSSGDVGVYQAVWNGPGPWSATVTTPDTRLEMRPLESLGIQRRGERRLTPTPLDSIDTAFKPGLRHQAEQLVLSLALQRTALATLADATQSMRLCADIYGLR